MARRRGHGEGSIRKRADGRWEALLSDGYDGQGRRQRRNFLGRTRGEVQRKLDEARQRLHAGEPEADDRRSVAEFLEQWLNYAEQRVRARTFERYRSIVRQHLIPQLGNLQLAKLSPAHVERMLAAQPDSGLSPQTVHHHRGLLRNALNVAQRWGLVSRNVAALAAPPKVTQEEVAAIGPEQARQILGAVAGDRLEALYALTLALGLRQSEVLGLRWEDVDLEGGTLSVRRTLQRAGGQFRFFGTKTQRSRRTLNLAGPLVEHLGSHRRCQLEERLAAGPTWEGERWGDLVFASEVDGPLGSYVVTTHFQRLLQEAGLPRMRFHDLRHAAATVMLTLGVQARVVMETLGHSQISTMMDRYSHVIPELQRDASERVGAALWDAG